MNKIFFIISASCILTACTNKVNIVAVDTSKKAPNIIYVLADDLGYGDIHTFNPEGKIKTPNIDKLALEGMKFTDAHTSSAVCTPTRYGILTGRYNWRSNLKSSVLTGKSKALIPTNRKTVADLLKQKNYHTAFIGKWHLGWDWALNPVVQIVPSAYVLTGLVALTAVANTVAATTFLQGDELAGAGRERSLAAIAGVSSLFLLGGGLTAGFTGAYARSIGLIAGSSARFAIQRVALRRVYRDPAPTEATSSPSSRGMNR